MAGKTLDITQFMDKDDLACSISEQYMDWEARRNVKVSEWREVQQYIYATDTTKTSNAKLPWSNKTTIPKLCQIRDNLHANYMASMFPRRKWLIWEGATRNDEDLSKRSAIESYIAWAIDRNEFYDEVSKLVLDYIDYGNCFATVDWVDKRSTATIDGREVQQVGYVGPQLRRISPIDIVFNPTSPDFASAPKIVRSLVTIGEAKKLILKSSTPSEVEGKTEEENLWDYMLEYRQGVANYTGTIESKDNIYNVAGFDNFTGYLKSGYVEILTFYGDIYNQGEDEFLENYVIQIVDRHKIISKKPNPSYFGHAPIYHVGWRQRPDNLWAMGPLDNLIGMQYRIDHLENLKADVFDINAYPPIKVKGYVEDFEWKPMERIIIGDDGDVDMLAPNFQILNTNTEIAVLEAKMEEMAGSPKEAMGFRTPGEKTKYEVQRLENAAARIFQSKISQFERAGTEQWLNAMLELSRRRMDPTTIRVFDSEAKIAMFTELSPEDITGNGRLKPVAARHFAERAEMLQNLTTFYGSGVGADPEVRAHISSVGIARMIEELLDVQDYSLIEPYIRLTEQAEIQRMANANQEQVAIETMTPAGIDPDDFDV